MVGKAASKEALVDDLLNRYGAVLEICSALGLAYPQDFLPDKKETIAAALISAYGSTKNKKLKERLGSSLVLLSSFVPMKDALTVFEFQRYVLNENNAQSIHPEDKQKKAQFKTIMDKINSEGERYLQTIREIDKNEA